MSERSENQRHLMETASASELSRVEDARQYMRSGNYIQAKSEFLAVWDVVKTNSEILCDLAACCYVENQFEDFEHYTIMAFERFKRTYMNGKSELAKLSLVTKLGMALEELGMVAAAHQVYKVQHDTTTDDYELRKRILDANLARLSLELGWSKEMVEGILLRIEAKGSAGDFSDRHILLARSLFEASFVSLDSAIYKLDQFFGIRLEFNNQMRMAPYFGAMFIALRRGQFHLKHLNLFSRFDIHSFGSFEQALHAFCKAVVLKDFSELPSVGDFKKLNPMDRLKFAKLCLEHPSLQSTIGDDFRVEALAVVNQLGKQDRTLVLSAVGASAEFEIESNIASKKPKVEGENSRQRAIKLSKSASRLLRFLNSIDLNDKSLYEVALNFFGDGDLFSLENRMRVLIYRVNKEFFMKTGYSVLLRVENGKMLISRRIEFDSDQEKICLVS